MSTPGGANRPRLVENVASLIGLVLAVGGATSFAFLLVLDLLPGGSDTYSILNLVPSLAVFLLGALIVLAGIAWEWRRRRRGRGASLSGGISIDPQRLPGGIAVAVAGATMLITLAIALVGGAASRLYAVTESNTFCGEACHAVMHPEWTTFHNSPHARLHCVDCHVGPKVEHYTLVKLNGLMQLWAVATGRYERPVATPIHNLRPAREICEQCHWSGRFVGYRDLTYAYFLGDEENTRDDLRMLVKIGGGPGLFSEGRGIHYHMFVATRVEYVARDPARQEIRWVRLTDASGEVTEFEDRRDPLSAEDRERLEVRTMDCLDCHNRPAHRFPAPVKAVNEALAAGAISTELPYIKVEAVRALDGDYATRQEANEGIAAHLREFYGDNHSELAQSRPELFEQAIGALQKIHERTMFPEMRVDWSTHPDNIGHRDSPGCFRCHNDRMVAADGRTISTTCNTCHVILAQGDDVARIDTNVETGEPFFHAEEWDYLEEWTECVDCHTGGAALYE